MRTVRIPVVAATFFLLIFTACVNSQQAQSPDEGSVGKTSLRVVTTVAPLTNIVANVVGEKGSVEGIIPEGEDSHTFEPSPEVAKAFQEADIIFFNGLNLEIPALRLAESSKSPSTPVVLLGENTITPDAYAFDFSFPKEKGDPNPHLWMNPLYAAQYAKVAARELGKLLPQDASYFEARAERFFRERIEPLDKAIFEAVSTVPPEKRKLLTYHDSFAYFAPRYGFSVIGAIQPADFSEPTARDVAALVEQIKREQVPAIFGSEVYPSKVLETIARETGARYVTDLRDDTLPGDTGDPEHTYVGMMVENVSIIVEALGGNASALKNVPVDDLESTPRKK
jgi:ABC-type Zn uptake system ZnuABC Zn-binding protein ZnuA